ncbi:MAG: outer membrane lipoprotein carrier protein LolA [Legionellales bacterium]|nr:outer membrane lipoprotein carrier protein LolA [Legionellales bacterium]
MKLLSEPLVSSGTFILSKKKGLNWQQNEPFKSSLRVTSTRLEQSMMDNPPTVITKKDQPVIFAFSDIFLSVFQGDKKQVAQYFNLYFSGDVKKWQIALTPKTTPFNKAIKHIELSGGQYITSIEIDETQENNMIINLSNISQRNE